MKITKVTLQRINRHSSINKPGYCDTLHIIGEILNRAAIILGDSGNYEINDGNDPICWPVVYSDGVREFVSSVTQNEHEKRVVRGLSTRYPDWIQGTFIHGLNGVTIYDVNRLVKAILEN